MKAKLSLLIAAVISCSMTLHAVKLTFSNEILGRQIAIWLCDDNGQCHCDPGITIASGSQHTIDTDTNYSFCKGTKIKIQVVGLLLSSNLIVIKSFTKPTTFHVKINENEGILTVTE